MTLSDKILRYIRLTAIGVLAPLALGSCQDDLVLGEDEVARQDNLPLDFQIGIRGPETRGPSYFKTAFEPDEIVHIEGTFHLSDGAEDVRYAAMRYDGEKWSQYSGATGTGEIQRFAWPNNAVSADFKAYYLAGSNSLMRPVDDPSEVPATTLSSVVGTSTTLPDRDPLVAEMKGVKYGHTIVLDFIHACSYLTVEDLQGGISNVFWFSRKDANGETPEDFHNAFRLYLSSDKRLHFDFVQVPDPEYGNDVYIQGTTKTGFQDGFEKSTAGFFLEPGQYVDFVVGYPGASSMETYISYVKQNTGSGTPPAGGGSGDGGDIEGGAPGEPSTPGNPDNILKANGVYTFNVAKSTGVKIENVPNIEEWDETEDPIYNVDAEGFLWAVCMKDEYWVDGVQIVKPEGSTSNLLHNVNIQWAEYTIFPPSDTNKQTWFEPILGQEVTFEGGGHYIYNLGSPLFTTVKGTVRHLGIKNAEINTITVDEYTPGMFDPTDPSDPSDPDASEGSGGYAGAGTYDLSRQGAICGFLDNGTIENIRVKSGVPAWYTGEGPLYKDVFTINAKVYAVESQESHSIGCLVGSSTGTINNINIFNDMTLNVSNYTEGSKVPRTYIGGIIGQNTNQVYNITSGSGNNKITISNTCSYSNASYSIGGVVGLFSTGTINNVTLPWVSIDSRKSEGFTSYIGGAAGRLSDAISGGKFLDVSVAGMVMAGKCMAGEEGAGQNFTGGLVGDCYESYNVQGCYTGVDVFGPNAQNMVSDGTTVATGGMFGRINKIPGETPEMILSNIATCKYIRASEGYTGTFSGLVPEGETWEKDYAGNELLVPSRVNGNQTMPEIGGTM